MRIHLLGEFAVTVDGQVVPAAAWRLSKARTLVKLLALAGPSYSLHREVLIDALWPDAPLGTGEAGLHQVVYCARRALDPARKGTNCLRVDGDLVALRGGRVELWVDVDAFEHAAAAARASGAGAELDRAIALYVGDLLPEDRYADWAAARRDALRSEFTSLLVARARLHLRDGAAADAVGVLNRAVAADPLHEDAHVELMRAHAAMGQRAAALRVYEKLRATLQEELGVDPSTAATRLYEEYRTAPPAAADPRAAVAPAAASSGPARRARAGLPRPLTTLVGREREIAAAVELLGRPDVHLVTFLGPGGTGKTRLAIAVAEAVAHGFTHGVAFVDLAPVTDPSLVLPTIARALGLEESQRDVGAALAAQLGGGSMLLVLDNLEQVLDAATAVADLVARCPGLNVLTTSRAALRVRGEWEFAVPPLRLPNPSGATDARSLAACEAVQLFVERARAVRADFELTDAETAAVAELCRRLDGLPLAIELAAARVRLFAPAALVDRLERRLPLLTGGAKDLPARHQTLRDALAWSYDLLNEEERRAFRRLGVFSGGWTVEAAEAVLGCADAVGVLDSLASQTLVGADVGPGGTPRCRMLETMREYALEQLAAHDEERDARDAHLDHFRDAVEQASRRARRRADAAALAWAEAELPNLRAALAWCRDGRPGADDGLALVYALWHFWRLRGHVDEGRAWSELFLSRATKATLTYAAVRLCAGELAWAAADYAAASSHVARGRDLYEELGDGAGVLRATNLLAQVEVWSGHLAAGRPLCEAAIAAARASGDRHEEARGLLNLGQVTLFEAWHEGSDPRAAGAALTQSLELFRQLDNRRTSRYPLTALAAMHLSVGEMEAGRDHLLAAMEITTELGDRWAAPWQLDNAAILAMAEGDMEGALRLLGSADAFHEATRAPRQPIWAPLLETRRLAIVASLNPATAAAAQASGRATPLETAVRAAADRLRGGTRGVATAA